MAKLLRRPRSAAFSVIAFELLVQSAGAADPAQSAQKIASGIAATIECKGAAVALAISGKSGSVRTFAGSVRYASPQGQSANADTVFEIGSLTKTFTALLFAEAVEKKLVKPTDPVGQYLPAGTKLPSFSANGKVFPIRLIDLATHSSGLPRGNEKTRYPYSPEQMFGDLAGYKLSRRPGTAGEYSNVGFTLLASAMERVFQAPLDRLLSEHVALPLKLSVTRIADPKDPRIPVGYQENGQPGPAFNSSWPAFNGAGAIASTLSDMQLYLEFAAGGGPAEMARLRPLLFDWRSFPNADGKGMTEQGLGWQRLFPFGNPAIDVVWKDGGLPSFVAYAAFSQKLGVGAVVLANRNGCNVVRAGLCVIRAYAIEQGLAAPRGPNCEF